MAISKGVSICCLSQPPLLLVMLLPFLLHVSLLSTAPTAAAAQSMARPGCPDRCGDVDIPYPFGIGTNCARPGLNITCNSTHYDPPAPFINTSNIQITNISLAEGQLRVRLLIAYRCYNQTYTNWSYPWARISNMYKFSKTHNRFFAVGCQTLAYIEGTNEKTSSYASGCVSFCTNDTSSLTEGTCDGIGCCQTSIPEGLRSYNVSMGYNTSSVWEFNPCSYAFLAEQSWYNFSVAHLHSSNFAPDDRVPVVIDWAIRDNSSPEEVCLSKHSSSFNSTNGGGYRCKCEEGYDGNPYLEDGCQDIDECENKARYPCYGTCTNEMGGYKCECPHGMHGDAKNGTCTSTKSRESIPLLAKLAVGISAGIVILVAVGSIMLMTFQKRKHKREKEMFFDRNGGIMLYEEMRSRRVDTVTVFSKMDLEKATNNFDDDRVVGAGGRGMVYKGILDDGREVAIKRSKIVDESQKEEFVNEIIILSQINHRNVVRLLGCCLEVDVPMLVYEFVSNGTLYDAIHNSKNQSAPMPLATRIKIASESAEALAYLHSSITRSIVHGDVKSLNILLDDKGRAKVSDFGASQLVPMDESGFVQFMQGTLGYLDPESLLSHQLTDKSDVYSFGVVLLELITSKKPIYSDGSEEKKSLASSFLVAMKAGKLQEILDEHVLNEVGGMDEMLRQLAELAHQCLSVRGDERPSMKEVAEKLHALAKNKQHPWRQQRNEETKSLLGDSTYEYSTGEISVNQSLDSRLVVDIDVGGR